MTHIGMARDRQSTAFVRLLLFVCLAVAEMLATSLLFVLDRPLFGIEQVQYYVRQLVLLVAAGAVAFVLITWPKRHALLDTWRAPMDPGSWRLPLAVNLAVFAVLAAATVAFSQHVASVEHPPWAIYGGYLALLAVTGVSLLWVAAPISVWRVLLVEYRLAIALAACAGFAAMAAADMSRSAWNGFSGITLRLSYAILSLYESDARVSYAEQWLGIGNKFEVGVDASCSGYEGIGLVTVFLSLYLWVFRGSLRFPQALLLLPIGIVTIWLLNAVRIAVLVSIGAHVSPEVAIGGFHSQAGWIAFLLVAIGIMAMAPRIAFFANGERAAAAAPSGSERLMFAYLAPFMCLMAASIIAAAAAPYDAWLYLLKVAMVGACLWLFRDIYRDLLSRIDLIAMGSGIAVGMLWVVTAPTSQSSEVAAWIVAQPVWLAAIWLVFRALGSIVMIPIAEELAFRGLLYRWLISRNFETVSFATFSWLALIVSSLLFGLMHQRIVAGALAGAVFALLMFRSGRLSDAIVSHMAANAVIVVWAIAAQHWHLL